MLPYKRSLPSALLVLGLVSVGTAAIPTSARADVTQAKSIMCTLKRLGDCKADGTCIWKDATERQARRKLKVDFEAKKAEFVEPAKTRPGGTVVKDEIKDGVRHFSLARRPGDPVHEHMTATLSKAGVLRLLRNRRDPKAPRIAADAMCVQQ